MSTTRGTGVKLAEEVIRFEIRDGTRRVSFVVSNEALRRCRQPDMPLPSRAARLGTLAAHVTLLAHGPR